MKQPNLYSIIEGHMDAFFFRWAGEIKQMKGTVWVRILHEFNGDWYPWCIVNNDRDPALFIKAYHHIHDLFKKQGTTNVKFVWCPNSMSVPQESWNFIMDAYPGDEYVDVVGMDVYNGAGDATRWHSFRRVAIENYFLFTQLLPQKPLVICETASRERSTSEPGPAQTKAEWIKQMSETLQSDMTKVKLLTWFNEKSTFKINSSPGAKKAFHDYIFNSSYFKDGNSALDALTDN
jgi:beta-mannanase